MSGQESRLTTTLKVVGVCLLAVLLIHQEMELRALRALHAEQSGIQPENPVVTAEPSHDSAEIQALRAEVAQLRREKLDVSAFRASMRMSTRQHSIDHRAGNPELDEEQAQLTKAQQEIAQYFEKGAFEAAARHVAELPPGRGQESLLLGVLNQWTRADPAAAAGWLTQFTDGPLKERALPEFGRFFGLSDPNAGSAWLETLPSGASRESTISAYVGGADGVDIKLAMEWANRHGDMEARLQELEGTGRRWLGENNAAARAWIKSAELPLGLAERLLGK